MKRLLWMVMAMIVCLSVVGCGKQAVSEKQPATADVAKAVVDQITFKDTIMQLDDKMVFNLYNIDAEKLAEQTCYVSGSGATAEEVSVFKVKDSADVKLVLSAIEERLQDQKIAFENYIPEEMVKINNAAVHTKGNYIILAVADDVSKVKDTFLAQF